METKDPSFAGKSAMFIIGIEDEPLLLVAVNFQGDGSEEVPRFDDADYYEDFGFGDLDGSGFGHDGTGGDHGGLGRDWGGIDPDGTDRDGGPGPGGDRDGSGGDRDGTGEDRDGTGDDYWDEEDRSPSEGDEDDFFLIGDSSGEDFSGGDQR